MIAGSVLSAENKKGEIKMNKFNFPVGRALIYSLMVSLDILMLYIGFVIITNVSYLSWFMDIGQLHGELLSICFGATIVFVWINRFFEDLRTLVIEE